MKLRLKSNTVRLRLEADEVERLGSGRSVCEKLAVGGDGAAWTYGIVPAADVEGLTLRLSGAGLAIVLPGDELAAWAASEQEGLYGEYEGVRVSLEKDRGCEHG